MAYLVQPHDQADARPLEVADVVLRAQRVVAPGGALALCVRPCEGQEAADLVPVQVAVLHLPDGVSRVRGGGGQMGGRGEEGEERTDGEQEDGSNRKREGLSCSCMSADTHRAMSCHTDMPFQPYPLIHPHTAAPSQQTPGPWLTCS